MRKNGRSQAGHQRWYCTTCHSSFSYWRDDQTRQATFVAFIGYLLGKTSQSELAKTPSGRTTRYRFKWCWQVPTPPVAITGEIYPQLFIDGIHLPYGWVLLTAVNHLGQIVNWQWANSENTAAYTALLAPLPPPQLITLDGAKGAQRAIEQLWKPHPPAIQRCLLHVHRNNMRDLTKAPKTTPGRALKQLSGDLLHITSHEQAATWAATLAQFHATYKTWINERTYAKDAPEEAQRRGKTHPRQWWYTHGRDRRVYYRLKRLLNTNMLFNYLTDTPNTALHKTTNIAESLNARIHALCYHHRGLSQDHMLTAIEWLLYYHSINPTPPKKLYTQWHNSGQPKRFIIKKPSTQQPETIGPKLYDNHITKDEGLYPRKGWAGRSF